jgi:hypothetical protein
MSTIDNPYQILRVAMNGKLVCLWKNSTVGQPIESLVSLRRPPYISVSSARLPMSAVNIDVMMPSVSTTAKPRIGPVPKIHSTMPAMIVVTFESAMAENAF